MKRASRLIRSQKEMLSKMGVSEEQQVGLRFYREIDGVPVFMRQDGSKWIAKKGEGLVRWDS